VWLPALNECTVHGTCFDVIEREEAADEDDEEDDEIDDDCRAGAADLPVTADIADIIFEAQDACDGIMLDVNFYTDPVIYFPIL